MSLHSFSICWLHIVFSTLNKYPILNTDLRVNLSAYFQEYSKEKNIYHKINFVNPQHVHLLVELPVELSISKIIQLYKGNSSNWINKNNFLNNKFYWSRGYGAFTVSDNSVYRVAGYIANQEEHHKKETFEEEYDKFIKLYNKRKR